MTVFRLKHRKSSSAIDAFELGWDFAEALFLPHARARSTNGLSLKTDEVVSALGKPAARSGTPRQRLFSFGQQATEVSSMCQVRGWPAWLQGKEEPAGKSVACLH